MEINVDRCFSQCKYHDIVKGILLTGQGSIFLQQGMQLLRNAIKLDLTIGKSERGGYFNKLLNSKGLY